VRTHRRDVSRDGHIPIFVAFSRYRLIISEERDLGVDYQVAIFGKPDHHVWLSPRTIFARMTHLDLILFVLAELFHGPQQLAPLGLLFRQPKNLIVLGLPALAELRDLCLQKRDSARRSRKDASSTADSDLARSARRLARERNHDQTAAAPRIKPKRSGTVTGKLVAFKGTSKRKKATWRRSYRVRVSERDTGGSNDEICTKSVPNHLRFAAFSCAFRRLKIW
jgi:hypothetical protein